jgi:glycogen debranching enzyme
MKEPSVRPPGSSPRRKRRAARGPTPEKNPYYIQASSPLADEVTRVLKHGDTFAVFDHYGDIKPTGLGEEGIYHEGTRFLSGLCLGLDEYRPLFLSSTVKEDNDLLAADLTNPDVPGRERIAIPRGTLHLARVKFLWHGVCYERLHLRNYGLAPITTSLLMQFEADYADIFEVRGTHRARRGDYLDPDVNDSAVLLAYRGLDGVTRRTRLAFTPRPTVLSEAEARFDIQLDPQQDATFFLTVSCEREGEPAPRLSYEEAHKASVGSLEQARRQICCVATSNEQVNACLNRSAADLHMMTTATPSGPYPYAGVPWFSTAFGRDGIITALSYLWLDPALARGVLRFLADHQAKEINPEKDAEPGKILHETRRGEMAALGEIPFGLYFGSVDSTPLFIMLAGAYFERTADREFLESIWPNVEAALVWVDTYGDADGDGFVEYQRHSSRGLVQQGWKDSHDAISHADGTLAEAPIALCEVQGYVYAARNAAAKLALALGREKRADALWSEARALKEHFERAFWCEDLGTYVLALDGAKKPCRVRSSNAGHCLYTSLASPDHARRTAQTLLTPDSFSGWGVRTLAAGEARYNPMSYHNGSVWPHDNALIADGFARYGLKKEVLQIVAGLFEASLFLDLHRLPELFCGFPRRPGEGPTLYPVACAPQAWSSAAVFLLLQACLGLHIDAGTRRIDFTYPLLPPFLREVHLQNLQVGEATLDVTLLRHGHDVGINIDRREGDVQVVMVK